MAGRRLGLFEYEGIHTHTRNGEGAVTAGVHILPDMAVALSGDLEEGACQRRTRQRVDLLDGHVELLRVLDRQRLRCRVVICVIDRHDQRTVGTRLRHGHTPGCRLAQNVGAGRGGLRQGVVADVQAVEADGAIRAGCGSLVVVGAGQTERRVLQDRAGLTVDLLDRQRGQSGVVDRQRLAGRVVVVVVDDNLNARSCCRRCRCCNRWAWSLPARRYRAEDSQRSWCRWHWLSATWPCRRCSLSRCRICP